jgi:alkylation response protein AidB-like acyl-CoA dehydrogenase
VAGQQGLQLNADEFRGAVRDWLAENLTGEFADLRGTGGPGREHEHFDRRLAWDRHLATAGWTCLGWPAEHGGRGVSLLAQVIFHEEYARAEAPARVNHVGENLLGPTLIEFGTPEQRRRFLPAIRTVRELWCQGYSEPDAGSDLASVRTAARRDGERWVVNGQKIWTSLAHVADWCFVLARTEPGSRRHDGLSYLLVPMHQDGVDVRPIRQLTGTAEFNEVYFTDAYATDIVGAPGEGWRVAMATLGFERGVATVGLQIGFRRELDNLVDLARRTHAIDDPLIRDRLNRAWVELDVMRSHALADPDIKANASVMKLFWSTWHQRFGELAMAVLGRAGMVADGEWDEWQRLFLFSRADTIYGGSNEIQRNIIAERALGLPREPR